MDTGQKSAWADAWMFLLAWEMVREIPEEAGTVSDETLPHDARNHRPGK